MTDTVLSGLAGASLQVSVKAGEDHGLEATVHRIVPVRLNHVTLPASDVEVSAGFYRRLGLTQIVANYPDYARLLSPEGDTTLSLHRVDATPAQASIHFEVEDVDEVVADLENADFKIECEPVDQPYLWREATLLDPHGNRVFIYHAGEMRLNPPWRLPANPEDGSSPEDVT